MHKMLGGKEAVNQLLHDQHLPGAQEPQGWLCFSPHTAKMGTGAHGATLAPHRSCCSWPHGALPSPTLLGYRSPPLRTGTIKTGQLSSVSS